MWTGTYSGLGYGEISDNGRVYKVHRWNYERVHGPILEGLVIDHLCHNVACCNVAHLRAVTQGVNLENRRGPSKNNTSGYLNVYWDRRAERWFVAVTVNFKQNYGGYFYSAEEAHLAAIALRERLHTK